MNIGDFLRDVRMDAGVSQYELARKARTTRAVIAHVESGRTLPKIATFARLMTALSNIK